MKKLLLLAVFGLSPLLALAQINAQCPQFTVNGTPQYAAQPGDQELCKTNYAVIHRCSVKAPVAVFEHLTVAAMSGPAKRRDNFHPDASVDPRCSASLADYAVVGKTHDRGHMAPAGNNTQNDAIMSESFNLSNMVAQVANNNRGAWRLLEAAERQWAATPGTDFYIISGGIYDQGHPVVGNGLGIPTRLYKIIIEKNSRNVQAYLMPNGPINPATDWPKYQTNMATIEQATGMKFNLGQ
jgi:endonuclease G, mitochondrial